MASTIEEANLEPYIKQLTSGWRFEEGNLGRIPSGRPPPAAPPTNNREKENDT
jgi:hypothetical protein